MIAPFDCVAQEGGKWRLVPVRDPELTSIYDIGDIIRGQLKVAGRSYVAQSLINDPPTSRAFTRNLKLSNDMTVAYLTLVIETMQRTPHKVSSRDGVKNSDWQHWRPKVKTPLFTDIYEVKTKGNAVPSKGAMADCRRDGKTESGYIAQMWVYGLEPLNFMTPPCPDTPTGKVDSSTPEGTEMI